MQCHPPLPALLAPSTTPRQIRGVCPHLAVFNSPGPLGRQRRQPYLVPPPKRSKTARQLLVKAPYAKVVQSLRVGPPSGPQRSHRISHEGSRADVHFTLIRTAIVSGAADKFCCVLRVSIRPATAIV